METQGSLVPPPLKIFLLRPASEGPHISENCFSAQAEGPHFSKKCFSVQVPSAFISGLSGYSYKAQALNAKRLNCTYSAQMRADQNKVFMKKIHN